MKKKQKLLNRLLNIANSFVNDLGSGIGNYLHRLIQLHILLGGCFQLKIKFKNDFKFSHSPLLLQFSACLQFPQFSLSVLGYLPKSNIKLIINGTIPWKSIMNILSLCLAESLQNSWISIVISNKTVNSYKNIYKCKNFMSSGQNYNKKISQNLTLWE